jgi:hypothetical protein
MTLILSHPLRADLSPTRHVDQGLKRNATSLQVGPVMNMRRTLMAGYEPTVLLKSYH